MVVHWLKQKEKGRLVHALINGIGAFTTGVTLLVVLVAKFIDGAWVTALLIPVLISLMYMVRRHYRRVAIETANPNPLRVENLKPPLVIIPLDRWSRLTEKALRFAMMMSPDVEAVHIDDGNGGKNICDEWDEKVLAPIREAGLAEPRLVRLTSPYRFIITPLLDYILSEEKKFESRQIAVLVPELVVKHWWENLLHNQRANLLKLLLLLKGNQRILVINIPWYLERG